MKYLLSLLILIAGCKSECQTIEIKIDAGAITGMIASGEFHKKGYKDVYYFCVTKPESKTGFIVATFHRGVEKEGKAYRLLDSLEMSNKYLNFDKEAFARLPADEQKEMKIILNRRWKVMSEINEHVFLVVSGNAIDTGIDYDSKLIYK